MQTLPDNVAEMLPEYDFTGGVRGKYVHRFRNGEKFVALERDVVAYFPDSESVNRALRALIAIAEQAKSDQKTNSNG